MAVLCKECWLHISDFNAFQQSILQVHAKFLDDFEQTEESPTKPANTQAPRITCHRVTLKDIENEDAISINSCGSDLSDSILKSSDDEIVQEEEFEIIKNVKQKSLEALESRENIVTHKSSVGGNTSEIEDIAAIGGDGIQLLDVISDTTSKDPELNDINMIGIKEEEPLEIVDVYVLDDSDDNDSYNDDDDDDNDSRDMLNPAFQTIKVAFDSDNSTDSYKAENPKKSSRKYKRTSAEALDDVIAQWMPAIECKCCQNTFPTYTDLQRHFRKMHPDEELSITCCGKVFKQRIYLGEHARIHVNPKAFECRYCNKCCTSKQNLSRHLTNIHPTSLGIVKPPAKKGKHKCNVCHKAFKVPTALREHAAVHTNERSYKCDQCEKSFKYRANLFYHRNKAHVQKEMPKPSGFFRICVHCKKIVKCRTGMYQHMRVNHPEKLVEDNDIRRHMLKG